MSDYRSPVIRDPSELSPVQRWMTEIDYAEKELEDFYSRARRVVRRYLDERDAVEAGQKWFNLFYANTKIMRAATYAQLPKPDVTRRFVDYNDDLARVAAEILQRCVSPDGDDPRDTFDPCMKNC